MLEVSSSTSAVVQGVLIALVIGSIFTWVLILIKAYQVWLIRRQNVKFRGAFWSASDLNAASKLEGHAGPAYRVAQVGFHALKDFDASPGAGGDLQHSGDRQDVLERALKQQIKKERFIREAGLVVLASIGSTAPFVGLFGTVWGIMHALTDISRLGSASLEVVAGPIGEALIATAIGIAVAVPAVLAYNFFLRRLKTSSDNLDDFAADLIKVSRRVTFQPRIETANTAQEANVVRNLKGAIA